MLVTKTYQKPTNLYQYITPTSAYPPWMMKGIVLSMLTTYYFQNTYKEDYSSTTETWTGGVPENQSPVSCGVRLTKVAV